MDRSIAITEPMNTKYISQRISTGTDIMRNTLIFFWHTEKENIINAIVGSRLNNPSNVKNATIKEAITTQMNTKMSNLVTMVLLPVFLS